MAHQARDGIAARLQGCARRVADRILACAFLGSTLLCSYPLSSQPVPVGTFADWKTKAAAAREAGRSADAIDAYQRAVALRPGWEEGWWYLGTMNYDVEHFADAERALRKVVELDSRLGPAWAFLGLCEFETRDYIASFTHLQRARDLGFAQAPEVSKVALYHLALLLNLNSKFQKATELLTSQFAAGGFPEQIKTALGLALLRIPLLPNQVDPAKDSLLQAAGDTAALLSNRQTEQALASFEQMLTEYPDTPYLHYAYGETLLSAARYREAEEQFKQEAVITPAGGAAWIGLTELSLRQDRGKEAEEAARRAVQLNPRSADSCDALAHALEGVGKKADAAVAEANARRLAALPIPADILQVKRYALGGAASSRSVGASSKAAAEKSGDFTELARRAESAQAAGNLAESEQLYKATLALRPDWAQAWRMIGSFQYMDGRFPEAISDLKRAVTLDPKPPEAWTVLGLAEFETKDYSNALLHLKRGSEGGFGGNRAAVQVAKYHLALLLNLNGEYDRALGLLVPEVGAGPPSEEVQLAMGISLLRRAELPKQIPPAQQSLVSLAGRAATLLSESRYDQAFPIFDRLIRDYPDTHFLHFAYGAALASSANYDRAQAQLLEETGMNPSSPLPYVRLTSISLVLHNPNQALEYAKKAVGLAPTSAEAHYVLGRSLLQVGDAAGAVDALEAARRLAPSSPEVHFNLARAYAKTHRPGDADHERAEFERLQAQNPQYSYGGMGAQAPHSHDPMAGADAPATLTQ